MRFAPLVGSSRRLPDVNTTVKRLVRRGLERIAPRTWIAIAAARSRAHSHQLLRAWGLHALNQRLVVEIGRAVVAGPFKNLRLPPIAESEHIGPFLLGTYESELHAWWQQLLGEHFPQMLDVGAKFGFYAVAYARRHPTTKVVAFDPDPWARRATGEMAELNRTTNVRVESLCDLAWLRTNLEPNSFIVSDCEGYEAQLFCDGELRALASATMLIELHELQSPGVTAAIEQTFSRSHAISRVQSAPYHTTQRNAAGSLSAAEMTRLACEIRGPQVWLLLRPRIADMPADRHCPNQADGVARN